MKIEKALNILNIGYKKQLTKSSIPNLYADIICYNEKKEILLLKRTENKNDKFSNLWCLPGGHINIQEKIKDAAIRELEEEINIRIENLELYLIKDIENNEQIYFYKKIFNINPFIVLKEQEHSQYCWCNEELIQKLELIGILKQVLLQFLNKLK